MSCCNNRKKKFKDINHVSILAKQFAAVTGVEVALVKEGNYYNFYELTHANKQNYEVLQIFGVSTSETILQDSGDGEYGVSDDRDTNSGSGGDDVNTEATGEVIVDMGDFDNELFSGGYRQDGVSHSGGYGETGELSC